MIELVEKLAKAFLAIRGGSEEDAFRDANIALSNLNEDDRRELLIQARMQRQYEVDANGCWVWTGPIEKFSGYGRVNLASHGKVAGSHAVSFRHAKGKIAEGLVVDHICRNRSCINPDHLRAVTPRENVLIGVGPSALNAVKTKCKNGHALEGDNIYFRPSGGRSCRICMQLANRQYEARQREKTVLKKVRIKEFMCVQT